MTASEGSFREPRLRGPSLTVGKSLLRRIQQSRVRRDGHAAQLATAIGLSRFIALVRSPGRTPGAVTFYTPEVLAATDADGPRIPDGTETNQGWMGLAQVDLKAIMPDPQKMSVVQSN